MATVDFLGLFSFGGKIWAGYNGFGDLLFCWFDRGKMGLTWVSLVGWVIIKGKGSGLM